MLGVSFTSCSDDDDDRKKKDEGSKVKLLSLIHIYNTYRYTTLEEIEEFKPELVIHAATVKYTLDAFHQVLPALPKACIISDIASVKTGLKEFYDQCGFQMCIRDRDLFYL